MSECVHIHYPLHGGEELRPLDVRVAIHQGTVEEVASEIQRGLESHGHPIERDGGDWTGLDGKPRALTWQITVTLDTGYVGRWQHIVRDSGDLYLRIPPAAPKDADR